MAIDSQTKRMSAASVVLEQPLVLPDGTIGQGDRQTIAYLYSGILASTGGGAVYIETLSANSSITILLTGNSVITKTLSSNSAITKGLEADSNV